MLDFIATTPLITFIYFLALPYATPVDIWACGCIFAELFTRRAFIMGQTEIDQLTRIFSIIGTPSLNEWPTETHIMRSNFSTMQRKDLSELIPNIPPVAQDLIQVSSKNQLILDRYMNNFLKNSFSNSYAFFIF